MPTFDTFVSYNRRHSNFARRIAEILRSNGLSVWFDEYEMLKFTKAATNSKEVSVAISDGVAQSASGLLITNDDYLTSSPCMSEEACPLLSRHPQIPIFHHSEPLTESAEGALSRLASHPEVRERGCRSWEDVVAELARFFKREIRVPHTASSMPSRDYNWHINAHEFVFDVTGWDISSEKISVQSGDAAGPQLWRTIDGVRLGINVTVGKNGNTRADIESTWKNETADSRWKYYEYAIGQAQWFVTGRNGRETRPG